MRSPEIRERFLRFFAERGHQVLESYSLIPHDDPSLLFNVAGMVPLKPFISGQRTPPSPRLVSCQKCFRGAGLKYDDIASVGDTMHNTFFEMLGNWSIGDYFKEPAIEYAWDLVTGEFGLDPERIWPSVYPTDSVSVGIWVERIGIPRERVARIEDNWWAAGPTGPCGYDSELYFDWGAPCTCGRVDCRPDDECGGDRWMEFWNLVFMEFDQHEDGSRVPLPKPTVDTGMGLERMTAVIQQVRSVYDTDLFAPLVRAFEDRSPDAAASPDRTRSYNVLADHLRGAGFLVAAGVLPSNEGRGYVLRRVVRRAAIHGRRVGLRGGLAAAIPALVEVMGGPYPELIEHRELIEATLKVEEEGFARTLEAGEERLATLLGAGASRIDGSDAFRLYDTFGLPIELTVEMAAERGASVDQDGFRAAMDEQRARSQAHARRVGFDGGAGLPPTRFVGYDTLETDAVVVRIGLDAAAERLEPGATAQVLLDVSPFYAEAGGQVGDSGTLEWASGSARVTGTAHIPGSDARAHDVAVESGVLEPGVSVAARVDSKRRGRIARHHSATHLLNRALRDELGAGIVQRGSFVGPDHTTFDFSFTRALDAEEIARIEHNLNDAIRRNLERSVASMPLAEARASGAIALLDEAYSAEVRVIDFGGWSRELCGGTHVARSGDLGAAMIVSESSIGQGVRRIELVAGEAAEERWRETGQSLQSAARALRARPTEVPGRVESLLEQVKRLGKEIEQSRRSPARSAPPAAEEISLDGVRVAHVMLDDGDVNHAIDTLFADRLQGDGVAVVMAPTSLAVKVGGSALDRGVNAGELVRVAAEVTGARGGGGREFARGGVGDRSQRDRALAALTEALRGTLSDAGDRG